MNSTRREISLKLLLIINKLSIDAQKKCLSIQTKLPAFLRWNNMKIVLRHVMMVLKLSKVVVMIMWNSPSQKQEKQMHFKNWVNLMKVLQSIKVLFLRTKIMELKWVFKLHKKQREIQKPKIISIQKLLKRTDKKVMSYSKN